MNKRNYFWDFWKFIAAIGVILVHVPFRGTLGTIMDCVGTWGVTFFFLISGFALAGNNRIICGKILKRLRRNGIITAVAVAAYFLFSYLWARRDNGSFLLWKVALRKPITYVKMLFLGDFECIYGTALWFMIALLYCYLIFYILIRFNLKKVIYILLPIFLIIRIVVDVRVISYGGDWHLSANALVAGLPLMLLGYAIGDNKDRLMKIPTWTLVLCSVITAGIMLLTACVKIGRLNVCTPFKILCAALVLTLGVKKPEWYIVKPIAFLGREDSLYIYLIHFMYAVTITEFIQSRWMTVKGISWQIPLLVIIASVITARIISMLVKLITKAVKKKQQVKAS